MSKPCPVRMEIHAVVADSRRIVAASREQAAKLRADYGWPEPPLPDEPPALEEGRGWRGWLWRLLNGIVG